MATKVKFLDLSLIIYKELSSVLGFGFLASFSCIGFGLVSTLMLEDIFPRLFGAFFIAVGILLMIGLFKYYAKYNNKVGAVIFEANENGISESHPLDTLENKYLWNAIEKIILTSKYVEKGLDSDGTSYSWNVMLIFFNKNTKNRVDFIQLSQKQISISPKGNDFITISLPKSGLNEIKEKLDSLAKNKIEILVCERVEFHYGKDTETISP
ncbi:MAG: hypothetical protein L3J61_02865 [Ghiorsea sp.]|nr:hypothetical protein [Ghiorsea sp.]